MEISVADKGENLAAELMENEGWEILDRNVNFKLGELDIVAQKTMKRGLGSVTMIAFIEVKTRTSTRDPRSAERAVTPKKRKKVILASKLYMKKNHIHGVIARFDVIAITLHKEKDPDIRHYPNAYDARGQIR